jgi:hypothetical protein
MNFRFFALATSGSTSRNSSGLMRSSAELMAKAGMVVSAMRWRGRGQAKRRREEVGTRSSQEGSDFRYGPVAAGQDGPLAAKGHAIDVACKVAGHLGDGARADHGDRPVVVGQALII